MPLIRVKRITHFHSYFADHETAHVKNTWRFMSHKQTTNRKLNDEVALELASCNGKTKESVSDIAVFVDSGFGIVNRTEANVVVLDGRIWRCSDVFTEVAAENALELVQGVNVVVKKAFNLCFVFNGFLI